MALTRTDLQAIKGLIQDSASQARQESNQAFDELIILIGQGFSEVSDCFSEVSNRFDLLEADIADLKTNLSRPPSVHSSGWAPRPSHVSGESRGASMDQPARVD